MSKSYSFLNILNFTDHAVKRLKFKQKQIWNWCSCLAIYGRKWNITIKQPIWDFSYFALSQMASRNVFLAKKQIFSKNANFVLDFKEAKLSPSWMVLTAEIWEHNETFCYYFLMFWQKISLCPQISAVSTIQQDSIWLLWNTKQRGHFLKIFVFLPEKHSLKLYGITQNIASAK